MSQYGVSGRTRISIDEIPVMATITKQVNLHPKKYPRQFEIRIPIESCKDWHRPSLFRKCFSVISVMYAPTYKCENKCERLTNYVQFPLSQSLVCHE